MKRVFQHPLAQPVLTFYSLLVATFFIFVILDFLMPATQTPTYILLMAALANLGIPLSFAFFKIWKQALTKTITPTLISRLNQLSLGTAVLFILLNTTYLFLPTLIAVSIQIHAIFAILILHFFIALLLIVRHRRLGHSEWYWRFWQWGIALHLLFAYQEFTLVFLIDALPTPLPLIPHSIPLSVNGLIILAFNIVLIMSAYKEVIKKSLRLTASQLHLVQKKYRLSAREVEVLHHIIRGKSNQDIADELFISITTVKTHIKHLFQKMQVSSRYELERLS